MTTAISTNNFNSTIEKLLPALSGSNVTYNEKRNMFLSQGYTSAAGNTYFQGLRLSNRIIINYDFGQGYYYLFLNGIRIYGYDGKEKRLISSRSFYNQCFSEYSARIQCIDMIKEYLTAEMKLLNAPINKSQIEEFSNALVDGTNKTKNLI